MANQFFKSRSGKIPYPLFFPDATRAVVRTLTSEDLIKTKTSGILVNTLHLYWDLGESVLKKFKGISNFMNWPGAVISDSGGFQVMSLAKKGLGKVTDEGVRFNLTKKKQVLLTPELSIKYQSLLKTDLMVVLDDFTPPGVTKKQARETVERTIEWARRCKTEFAKIYKNKKDRPYLISVVHGGDYLDLRKECTERLAKIGFDGYGYGGWPMDRNGKFNLKVASVIRDNAPKDSLLYGLGVGKPEDIIACYKLGFKIFDCVIPTRDARHGRLFVFKNKGFDYESIYPQKSRYKTDRKWGYLHHLFKIKDPAAWRLATMNNLSFYSTLMAKLREA
ncbi:MAG: tRNA guanosine(34) transglycosylase Tgt [Candidatus Beckwithbacteria bacterium]|nr:tRNA guanosine(34) transglycosylase Tgt [Candidatus Beckwithbacteria bacterium]